MTIHEKVVQFNMRVLIVLPALTNPECIKHTKSEQFQKNWRSGIGITLSPVDVARSIKFVYEQPQEVSIQKI